MGIFQEIGRTIGSALGLDAGGAKSSDPGGHKSVGTGEGYDAKAKALSPTAGAAAGAAAGLVAKLTMPQVVAALKGTRADASMTGAALTRYELVAAAGKSMKDAIRTAAGKKYPSQTAFFEDIVPDSVAAQLLTGVPASVTMAQAAQETGYGKSATKGNNYFGSRARAPRDRPPSRPSST